MQSLSDEFPECRIAHSITAPRFPTHFKNVFSIDIDKSEVTTGTAKTTWALGIRPLD